MDKIKEIKRFAFDATLEDYDDKYQFKISCVDPNTKKDITLTREISVTEVYDEKGYQHRYVLKKFVEGSLDQFEKYMN